jgi:ribosomal protein S18 acetylase RimI-like enzyme
MQVKIRSATEQDAPAAARLMTQLAEETRGNIDPGVEDRLGAMIELPQHAIFVAEDEEGQVAGLLNASQRWTLWHTGPCALIEELVVDEGARRQGIGRALIGAALDWAGSQGCSEVEVSTDHDNTDAQAFYRQIGFESEALLMEYELDQEPNSRRINHV